MFYFLFSCKSVKCFDLKACNDFNNVYVRIENYYKGAPNSFLKSEDVKLMTRLTNIEPDYDDNIIIDYIITKNNLKDWRNWYNKNKNRLYWDEIENKVKVKE